MSKNILKRGKPKKVFRKRGVQRITNVNRSLQPIASRYICKMKYATNIVTDATGQYVLNLNSVYDPDRTGIGHQPYGYDTLGLMYNRYRVISCGWRINQATGTAGTPVTICTMPSNDLAILWTNFGQMVENPRVRYVTQNIGASAVYNSGKQYLPALMGRTKPQYMADDKYQAVITANPDELGLLYVQTFNGLSGDPFNGIGLNVILEFTVEWFDVKHQLQS